MSETRLPKISSADQENLQHLSNLLHLFHHRNKNQHRRSTWYRHFSLFRKQLNTLLSELTALNSTPSTHLARVRKKGSDKKLRIIISQRLNFWQGALVFKWQRAFSQLVADGRFAQLGLVLLAILGRVCAVVGITAGLEETAERETERVLEDFGREFGADGRMDDGGGEGGSVEDVGVVVERDGQGTDDAGKFNVEGAASTADTPGSKANTKRQPPTPLPKSARKKRKSGRGNAIDDLFDSLD